MRRVAPTTAPANARTPDQTEPGAMGRNSIPRPTAMGVARAASRPRTRGASPARDRRNHHRTPLAATRRRGGRPRQGRAGSSPRRADDRDRCASGQRNLLVFLLVPGLSVPRPSLPRRLSRFLSSLPSRWSARPADSARWLPEASVPCPGSWLLVAGEAEGVWFGVLGRCLCWGLQVATRAACPIPTMVTSGMTTRRSSLAASGLVSRDCYLDRTA